MNCSPVSLPQMLEAREARARRQAELLRAHPGALISFTMNIAGPIKNSPLIEKGFDEGLRLIRLQLDAEAIGTLRFEEIRAVTGCEAFFAVDAGPTAVKALMSALEDENDLGRLFDIDVLRPDGSKVGRADTGAPPRRCLLCGQDAAVCGSRRLHTVEALQERTRAILRDYLDARFADRAASLAQRALLFEVCVTPKPGLVDRANNGAHTDMDLFDFCASAAALGPYFRACARIGMRTCERAPGETFCALVLPGRRAEGDMARATGGVNTHKGAIYSMGVFCAALGRQFGANGPADADAALALCGDMTREAADRAFDAARRSGPHTVGARLFLEHGIRGIRGEAAEGFPHVRDIALPALRDALARGESRDAAGARALLALIASVTDTNMIARGGMEAAEAARARAAALRSAEVAAGAGGPEVKSADLTRGIEQMDADFIAARLSPGGCADLLSLAWMARFVEEGLLDAP